MLPWQATALRDRLSRTVILIAGALLAVAVLLRTPQPSEPVVGLRVVVSGASSGIGEELAYTWARLNASLVLCARRQRALDEVSRRAVALGAARVMTVASDLGGPGAGQRLVKRAHEWLGGIDVRCARHAVRMNRCAGAPDEPRAYAYAVCGGVCGGKGEAGGAGTG